MAEHRVKNMEEFARLSGLSRPTLSKFFNDPQSVRASTRAKIEAAQARYDYTPNIYAMNQNRKLTRNIGIVVPYLADPFFGEVARNLENLCIKAGYRPSLFSSHGAPDQERDILGSLRSMKPAGVLLAPIGRISDRAEIERFCADVPTVLFDSNLEGIGEAFVGSDNFSFVDQTVEYLVRTGGSPVFYEMRTPANPNARKRRAAYETCMDAHGLEPRSIQIDGEGWAFEEIGRLGAHQMFASGTLEGDTILCSNDRLAIGLLAAAYERGLKVGRTPDCDLRVASNDDHPFSRFTCPSLTTAAHDYDSVASESVRTLFELIQSGGRLPQRHERLFEPRLILRESA